MKVFNTLSGQKEDFRPSGEVVTMYVCGTTAYGDCHIGHAMTYIVFDVIKRYLKFKGHKVKHVQNFTDIDDKIIERANRLAIPPSDLANKYIGRYFAHMDALNIQRADVYPKATEEMSKIIEIIRGLLAKGYAYHADGSVYFRVRSFPRYGKLSHRDPAEMISEAYDHEENKEYPLDFALWKVGKPGEPVWQSPWGEGRPGWHVECSAMALKYLGDTIDIHGGGQDLVFPHHENEIAQSESFTGVLPFVRYWVHSGLVQQDKQKMSRSTGNLVGLTHVLDHFSSDAIRLFFLGSHLQESGWLQQRGLGSKRESSRKTAPGIEPKRQRSQRNRRAQR